MPINEADSNRHNGPTGIEHYLDPQGNWLALVIREAFREPGIHFFTPNDFSQQFGYMQHGSGHQVIPHTHNVVQRSVTRTQEVLFVRSGRCRVDLYTDDQVFVASVLLAAGDWILLAGGGHGLETLEEAELFEIKQGPFIGEMDKTRFEGTPE